MIRKMCRMLGYLGGPVRLAELIEQPPHSLERQSYAARELRGATVCADGWGAGFYVPDDELPCLYRSTLPIWADNNRSHLGRAIQTRNVLACVRSATDPLSVSVANTPPFSMGPLMLVHNGYIENFSTTLRRPLEALLSDEHYRQIRGRTDSEYLLANISDEYARLRDEPADLRLFSAVRKIVQRLLQLSEQAQTPGLFTLIVSDGRCMIALRSAYGDLPPTLYALPGPSPLAPGVLVASEPLDSSPDWRALDPGQAMLVRSDGSYEQVSLS